MSAGGNRRCPPVCFQKRTPFRDAERLIAQGGLEGGQPAAWAPELRYVEDKGRWHLLPARPAQNEFFQVRPGVPKAHSCTHFNSAPGTSL